MESDRPMDRLVCGDVGFGKTEVAIRAAFKAVADNKQVAVLVPTTVLAYQHFQTFRERLKGFAVSGGIFKPRTYCRTDQSCIEGIERWRCRYSDRYPPYLGKKMSSLKTWDC